jgi:ADP-heptose:LPS heptosyltransferase
VRTDRIWQKRYPETSSFVGEQVLADVRAFGIEGPDGIHKSYGGDWYYEMQTGVSDGASPYLVLHPGAKGAWETKRWPDACWSELMRRILAESNLQLVLVGVAAELPHLQALLDGLTAAERARVAIQADASLQELALAVRGSAGVICHNSGVMHLAAMLGRPTLALTGSSPQCWRPPYAHVRNLTSGRCGLACNQYRCPVPFYRARCIKQLSVTQVLSAARTHFTIL